MDEAERKNNAKRDKTMKTKHEKFNYTARIAYICPCCDMEIGDSKPYFRQMYFR